MFDAALKQGDVLLFQGSSLFSRLIRLMDKTDVSHAALYTGGDPEDMAEATGRGLHTEALAVVMGNPHTEYVAIHRLAQYPSDRDAPK